MSIRSEYGGCRSRVCMEGRTGRRRHYKCRLCGEDFIHDGNQLPEESRICRTCCQTPAGWDKYQQGFLDKRERELALGLIP